MTTKAKPLKSVDSIPCRLSATDANPNPQNAFRVAEAKKGASGSEQHYRFTTLETPISANRYWRVVNNRIYVSREAEAFKKTVAWEARRAGVPCLSGQPVEVKIFYYHEYPKRRLDVDNILKIGIDALSGVAFDNDKRVVKVSAECWHDAEHPRLTFDLTYRAVEEVLEAMEEER